MIYADANTILRDIVLLPERFLQAIEELIAKCRRKQRISPRDYDIILKNLEILTNVINKIAEIPSLSAWSIDEDWLENQGVPSGEAVTEPDDTARDIAVKDIAACVTALRHINKLIETNHQFKPANIRSLYYAIDKFLRHITSHIEYDLDDGVSESKN